MELAPREFSELLQQQLRKLGLQLSNVLSRRKLTPDQLADLIKEQTPVGVTAADIIAIIKGQLPEVSFEQILAMEFVVKTDVIVIANSNPMLDFVAGKMDKLDLTADNIEEVLMEKMKDAPGGIIMGDKDAKVMLAGKPFMDIKRKQGESKEDFLERIQEELQLKLGSEGMPDGMEDFCQCPKCQERRARAEKLGPIAKEMDEVIKQHGGQHNIIVGKPITD